MINWNQFTVDNGAINDLRELLFLTVYDDPDIDLTVTTKTGVTNGQKLATSTTSAMSVKRAVVATPLTRL